MVSSAPLFSFGEPTPNDVDNQAENEIIDDSVTMSLQDNQRILSSFENSNYFFLNFGAKSKMR